MNLYVMDTMRSGQRSAGWSPTLERDFHVPARFGREEDSGREEGSGPVLAVEAQLQRFATRGQGAPVAVGGSRLLAQRRQALVDVVLDVVGRHDDAEQPDEGRHDQDQEQHG